MKPITCRVVARHHHAAVGDSEDASIGKGSPREQLLRRRLNRIADLARRIVETARLNPQTPASALVEPLTGLLEEATVST